jgi:hypothetical protein
MISVIFHRSQESDTHLPVCSGGAGLLTVTSVITTDLTSLRERGYYQGMFRSLLSRLLCIR